MEFLKKIAFFTLRGIILMVYFFFLTSGSLLLVLFIIFGFHCNIETSLLHIFSKIMVEFILCCTLLLSILLNFFSYGKKIQFFIGIPFLHRYLPDPLKGFLAFSSLIFLISLLDFFNMQSLLFRIEHYNSQIAFYSESLKDIGLMEWGDEFLRQLQDLEKEMLEKVPSKFPTKGVLTDYSERFVNLFK